MCQLSLLSAICVRYSFTPSYCPKCAVLVFHLAQIMPKHEDSDRVLGTDTLPQVYLSAPARARFIFIGKTYVT